MSKPKKPRTRVNLSLEDDMHDILVELSSLTGRSKAGIVTDFLYEVKPALEATVNGLKALKSEDSVNDALQRMLSVADSSVDELNEIRSDIDEQF